MKRIGLVGGISWSSTIEYYRIINEEINKKLGGLNFGECIIYSVNFQDFCSANAAYDGDATFALMLNAVNQLTKAGAELILLGANTAHMVADRIVSETGLPIIDIRVATAKAIKKKGLNKVGLLGTAYTMELDFYKNKLSEHQVEVLIPTNPAARRFIEQTLLGELGRGIINPETKQFYIQVANELIAEGAGGIVLGCTEIPLLLKQEDLAVPVFNTVQIHVEAAIESALTG